jgi:hypothetical protein
MKRKKRTFIRRFFQILLLLIVLFGGIVFYHDYRQLKAVHQYDQMVAESVDKAGISQYKDIVLAILMTESKGQGLDPMQSSESVYGERNQIQNPQESIDSGVDHFKKALDQANQQHTDIWTAVQAYNFGLDYIQYIAQHGGIHSTEKAEAYSRDILSPLLGNEEQKTYRYLGWTSLIYNGGYLYHNGGNLFYADLVKINQTKLKITNFLF